VHGAKPLHVRKGNMHALQNPRAEGHEKMDVGRDRPRLRDEGGGHEATGQSGVTAEL
jgi:hypothetical protein